MIPLLVLVACLSATEAGSPSYYQPVQSYGASDYIYSAHHAPSSYYPTYYRDDRHYGAHVTDYYRPVVAPAPPPKQDAKYYYGGKFEGSCSNDGLYYKDEATFVICSNGYPSDMSCPPGTKTAEYPSYKPGYYYGYTDLCSVNLVDLGYGPDSYTAAHPRHQNRASTGYDHQQDALGGYKDKWYGDSGYGDNAYPDPAKDEETPAYPKDTHHDDSAYKPIPYQPADKDSGYGSTYTAYQPIVDRYPTFPFKDTHRTKTTDYHHLHHSSVVETAASDFGKVKVKYPAEIKYPAPTEEHRPYH